MNESVHALSMATLALMAAKSVYRRAVKDAFPPGTAVEYEGTNAVRILAYVTALGVSNNRVHVSNRATGKQYWIDERRLRVRALIDVPGQGSHFHRRNEDECRDTSGSCR